MGASVGSLRLPIYFTHAIVYKHLCNKSMFILLYSNNGEKRRGNPIIVHINA